MVNVATVSHELQCVLNIYTKEWTSVVTQVLDRPEQDSQLYRKKTATDGVWLAAAGRFGALILQALWNKKVQEKKPGHMIPGVIDVSLIPSFLDTAHEELRRRPSFKEFVQEPHTGAIWPKKGLEDGRLGIGTIQLPTFS